MQLRGGPRLDELVPAAGHDDRVGGDRGEADAADPLAARAGQRGGCREPAAKQEATPRRRWTAAFGLLGPTAGRRVSQLEVDARVGLLVLDGVLALAEGVPELDGLVTGAGHDLRADERH